ncbi:MAG: T9SS type A sorting domain-containing protein [Ignavibacteriaceae bacterium]|jgi:hypothetical protein
MKKLLLLFILLSSYTFSLTGWFNDFVYLTINGVTGSKYYIGDNPGSGTQLDGSTLGGAINELKITSTDMKYWSDTQDRTGGAFYYKIMASDNTTQIIAATEIIWTQTGPSGNDYQGTWSGTINLLTGLEASTTYKLHIWAKSWGSGQGDSWLSNSSANYVGTFTTDGTVPVELSSFSASIKNKSVNLVWHTATEVNNYGFEIEKRQSSMVNSQWSKVGFVKGSGNSNSAKGYSFADNSATTGKYSYRIKQIDNDGKYEYSKEVEVDLGKPTTFALSQNYPNPFNPSTVISYQLPTNSYVTLKVYNAIGTEVTTLVNGYKEAGSYNYELGIGNYELSSGIYFYTLRAGDFVQTKKMILLK